MDLRLEANLCKKNTIELSDFFKPVVVYVIQQCSEHFPISLWHVLPRNRITCTFVLSDAFYLWLHTHLLENTYINRIWVNWYIGRIHHIYIQMPSPDLSFVLHLLDMLFFPSIIAEIARNCQRFSFDLTSLALSKPNWLSLNQFGRFETGLAKPIKP